MDAQEWDTRYTNTPWVWSADPNMWVVQELEGLRPGRALDLGAGEGRNAVWLARRGWQVDAVDFSRVALLRADELAATHGVQVATREADLTQYEPEGDAYDLVMVVYIHLAHADMEALLRRAARAARPGGTLLLVGHDVSNIEHGTGGPQDPEILTSVAQVSALWGEMADLEVAEVRRRPVAREDEVVSALDTVVRAVRR
ncbi:class I SAM-dependent methyltransferase [Streptomyces meridianus]|uniref:Methyltransferase domain-containing protein n=1 Tax=Streptomyces meridianus TaxID=2938945 RepID=A0ABT0X9M0_9ACTN|nr:class I SAM-dependent methyltransferase [Streptomyces meridianus]MCM2579035.1 methyltransferase domain-containing protein [Streptomyces meridianus]